MTARQAVAFVEKCGIVLESARGTVPSLSETIAGGPIQGSWWGHPQADRIFVCTRAIRNSKDVLTCRLIEGKVTYVHRRLWPALARLSENFKADRLAAIREIHTSAGMHKILTLPFSQWLSANENHCRSSLSVGDAIAMFEGAGMTNLKFCK
jgi:hypothetical protein